MQKKRTTTAKRATTATHKPRRRRTTHTAPVRRRRTTTRKKGMLSELFNPVMAEAAAKATFSGAIGGAAAGIALKIMPESITPTMKGVYLIGGGFAAATLLKMPNMGSGLAAVGMYKLLEGSGMLAEGETDYASPIESLPIVLNESQGSYLSDAYLSEAYLSEAYLSEDESENQVLNYDAFNY